MKLSDLAIHMKDGGMKSRKLWFSVATSVLIFASGLVAARWASFEAGLPTVVGGLLGALSLFIGGNVATKHVVLGKATTPEAAEAPKEPAEPT